MAYQVAVLDDDPILLEKVCSLAMAQAQTIGCDCIFLPFSNSYDVESFRFDAYLMDISMPEMDGIQLALRIRRSGSMCPIVFISGIEARVFEALRAQPLRFVRKTRLKEEMPEAMQALFKTLNESAGDTLCITTKRMTLNVPTHQLLYIESFDKMQRVVTTDGAYDVYSSMQYFETELSGRNFYRIHRGYLVNMSAVICICKQEAVMSNGTRLPISRFKVEEAKAKLAKEFFHP